MAVGVDQPLITLEAFLRRRETKPYTELIDGVRRRARLRGGGDEVVLEQLNGFSFRVDELFS